MTMAVLDAVFPVLPYVQWTMIIFMFIGTGKLPLDTRCQRYLSIDHFRGIGVAWSFNLWVVPIIKLNKSISAVTSLLETSRRGGMWLEPANAASAVLFGVNAILVSQHPDASEAALWKAYAISSAALFQVAWWERVFIFPLEEWIAALDKEKGKMGGSGDSWMDATTTMALHRDMDKWCRYHAVRATLPLIAGLVALSAKMRW